MLVLDRSGSVGLSPTTLRRFRDEGGGPRYYQPSERRVRYRRQDLRRWLEDQASS